MHKCFLSFLFLLVSFKCYNQEAPSFLNNYDKDWVESTFNAMTLDEKIGQLLMPRGNVSGKPHDIEKLAKWVQEYKIGGIVFFAGPPTTQAKLSNYLQSLSKVPMLIGEDFEWGLAMRMDSTDRYPYQMALGAMQGNENLIQEMGAEIGRQCKRLGVHVNYAPVVDVNNNIANPVINFRSFGSNKNEVAKKGLAYMLGLQSQNIIATAKHFPGHGDTDVDSHKDLPVIPHSKERLFDIELYPFQQLINSGLSGIMTAHLDVPIFEPQAGLAATFSKSIVSDLLRNKMGFKGLTFTDAMDMKGAVKNFPNGEAMAKAILAGNDVLETFEDLPTAFKALQEAVKKGTIPLTLLDEKVKKILKSKSWVGLNKYQPIEIKNLVKDLNSKKTDLLNRYFAESSITLIKNVDNTLPLNDLGSRIAVVSVDAIEETRFQQMCANYTKVDVFQLPVNVTDSQRNIVFEQLKAYQTVIVGLHLKEVRASSKYSINDANLKTIEQFSKLPNATICLFGNIVSFPQWKGIENFKAILACYQNTKYTEEAAAQIIFGGLPAKGKLPITLNDKYKEGAGIATSANRISYGIPDQVKVNGNKLNYLIDSIVNKGLTEKAYPGAVVQVIKNGKTIFKKAYGYHTFEDAKADKEATKDDSAFQTGVIVDAMDYFGPALVSNEKKQLIKKVKGKTSLNDLYDLASVTKVSASGLAGMQLMSNDAFDENKTFSFYIPELVGTNKENLRFKDMLTHKSGLQAWIPFWKNAIDTAATINKALAINPSLQKSFKLKITKPSFFKRLFGKKIVKEILVLESLKENAELWNTCLNTRTITWKANTFSPIASSNSDIKISDKLWMNSSYKNQIFAEIIKSPINPSQGYIYSDLHYYFYPKMIEQITKIDFETYLDKTYKSIGANTLGFNPYKSTELQKIVPTEYDSLFRHTLIHGFVHDEGAVMMGGVSGHAGLFGNANDLSKLMYMYLNKGSYGGTSYIKPSVLTKCTAYQFPDENNRRGLFFDKLDLKTKSNGPSLASANSFGHSGFTGTFVWLDPDNELLYVFLSNRVYPTRDNKKISELNIRTEVGNAIYRSME
jgi:beta-N-acetylhexosaminidase